MSLQEPQDQIEPEIVDVTEEQPQDAPVESALSDSNEFTSSTESESVDVPTDELESPTDEDTDALVEGEESDDAALPDLKSQPPSSGELPHSEVPEGPAGLAFPASSWRRTIALNFFAIFTPLPAPAAQEQVWF